MVVSGLCIWVIIEVDWAYRLYGEGTGCGGHYGYYGGESEQKTVKNGVISTGWNCLG